MATIATLSVLLKARDQLSGPLGKSQTRMEKMTAVAKKMSLGIGAAGVAIAGMAVLSIRAFAGFEQSMARAGALSGATADQLAQMTEVAKKMGRETQFSAKQAAGALSFLSQAGFKVEESMAALPGVLELAAAAQLDLARAADITSNVLTGYGLKVSDLSRVNDVLTKAFTSANTDLTQLGEALKLAGPIASAAGIRFEEATAALALMGNAGIQASMAGTSLRGAITKLLNPSKEAAGLIDEMGLKVTDAAGKMIPFVDIIRTLEGANLSAADAMTIFGQRAGPAMLALIGQGSAALVDFTEKLDNSGGTAKRIADLQMATLQGALTRLKSAMEGLAIAVGTILAPTIVKLANILQSVAGFLAQFIGKMKEASSATMDTSKAVDTLRESASLLDEALAAAASSSEELRKSQLLLQKITLDKQINDLLAFVDALQMRPQRDRFSDEIDRAIKKTTALLEQKRRLTEEIRASTKAIAGEATAFDKSILATADSTKALEKNSTALRENAIAAGRTADTTLTLAGEIQRIQRQQTEEHLASLAVIDTAEKDSAARRIAILEDHFREVVRLNEQNRQERLAIIQLGTEERDAAAQAAAEANSKIVQRMMSEAQRASQVVRRMMKEAMEAWAEAAKGSVAIAALTPNERQSSNLAIRTANIIQGIGDMERAANVAAGLPPGGFADLFPNRFAHGGIVGGPIGAPVPAIVHGGETIIPAGRGRGGVTVVNHFHGDIIGINDLDRHILKTVRNSITGGGLSDVLAEA